MENPEEKYFLTWDEAFQAGVEQVGGKGWNLGRLVRYGFKVPLGGVLTTQAYGDFIRQNRLQELVEHVSNLIADAGIEETRTHDKLNELRGKIIEGSVPQNIFDELTNKLSSMGIGERPLAIRSSASAEDSSKASFAGIHESFLHVLGLAKILTAVKGCYASLWSPQAIAYRKKLNIRDDEVAPAVVVMEMVEAQAAGVGFTCDPQTGRRDIMVVNANFGLGEAVVTGAVEPDTYYLHTSLLRPFPRALKKKLGQKEGFTQTREDGGTQFIRTPGLSSRQVLPDYNIEKLGLLLLRVFEALGESEQHQDVEWVYDGQDFVVVQARPVTALPSHTFVELKNQPDIWSNGNYRDAVPMVQSPLNRRLMKNIIDIIHDSSFTKIGYTLPEGLEFSRFFNGRLYANLAALQWALFDAMGAIPRDTNMFWGGHQPEIELKDPNPLKGVKGLKRLWHLIRAGSLVNKATKNADKIHTQVINSLDTLTGEGLDHLQDGDLIKLYAELGIVVKKFAREFWFLSGAATTPAVMLLKLLSKYFGDRAPTLLNALMVGGETAITSAEHGYRLMELAEIARRDRDAINFFSPSAFAPLDWEEKIPESSPFKEAFRQMIKDYGHRAVYELDIINPRWNEDPSYFLEIIRSTLSTANIDKLKAMQQEKFAQAWSEIKEKVPSRKQSSIKKLISQAQSGAAVREETKSVLALAMEGYRKIALELGSRFCKRAIVEEQEDIFFCTWPEVVSVLNGEWDGLGLKSLIADRKATRREKQAISPPDIIFGETPKFTEPVTSTSGNCLQGVPVAAGKASGTARLIFHPGDGSELMPGDVLITPSTDPGWTPLFLKAGALVMETGGFLSHGAIVAREYGVPAVVNIPGVMRVIKEGTKVVVDGDEGKIFLS